MYIISEASEKSVEIAYPQRVNFLNFLKLTHFYIFFLKKTPLLGVRNVASSHLPITISVTSMYMVAFTLCSEV